MKKFSEHGSFWKNIVKMQNKWIRHSLRYGVMVRREKNHRLYDHNEYTWTGKWNSGDVTPHAQEMEKYQRWTSVEIDSIVRFKTVENVVHIVNWMAYFIKPVKTITDHAKIMHGRPQSISVSIGQCQSKQPVIKQCESLQSLSHLPRYYVRRRSGISIERFELLSGRR